MTGSVVAADGARRRMKLPARARVRCATIAGMTTRVLVLGAGFGGLELGSMLSEALPDEVEVTLIDKSDCFVFGYSKLDVMFGRATPDAVQLPYREYVKPGVRLLQETITSIDPEARRVSPMPAATRPTCWSWRSAPTTT